MTASSRSATLLSGFVVDHKSEERTDSLVTEDAREKAPKSASSLDALQARWKEVPQLGALLDVACWLAAHLPAVEAARDLRHLQAQVEAWAGRSFKRGLATATVSNLRLEVVAGGRNTTSSFHRDGATTQRLKGFHAWTTVMRGAPNKEDYEVELDEPHEHISGAFKQEVDRAAGVHGLRVNPVATDVAFHFIERFAISEAKAEKNRPPSTRQLFAELMVAASVALVRADSRALREDMNSEDLRLLAIASGFEGAPGSGQTRASSSESSHRTLWRLKWKEAQETWGQVLNFFTADAPTVAEVLAATEAAIKEASKLKARGNKPNPRGGKMSSRSRRVPKARRPR